MPPPLPLPWPSPSPSPAADEAPPALAGHGALATPVTGGQRLVKHINRVALLRLLREHPGLSRADLADRSGLTRSTVSILSKELIDEGWVAEDAAEATGALGRRPTPLRLDGRGFAIIGAELSPDAVRTVTVSVQGQLLRSDQADLRGHDPDTTCDQLCAMVTAAVSEAVRYGRQVLGVGVGMPGSVDAERGELLVAPNIGWRRVPVGPRLRAALESTPHARLPVFVRNEADLAAIGEMEFGPRPMHSPLVYVSCGIGLGSGIVVDDSLFTGATGAAGEIGHTTLHAGGRPCSCGRLGCAEAYVGLPAIAAAAGLGSGAQGFDHEALRRMVLRRAPAAIAAFEAAGRELGVLLQNVWATLDPQLIVLGGQAVALGGEHFVVPAQQVLADFARRAALAPPRVRVTRFTASAAAFGGAAHVLRSLLHPYRSNGGADPGPDPHRPR